MRQLDRTFARLRTVLAALALGSLALASQAGTTDIYYHNDLAGTPMAATDGAGNVLWRQGYKPYGERINPKAPAEQLPWFTGKAHVEAAGLSYYGARWYDPALGRFMGVDPVGFSEANLHSFNRYAYANNNPYKFVDPDGRAAETVFDLISFGISVEMFRREPTLGNFLGAAVDGLAVAVPFVPGGVGAIRSAGRAMDAADAAVEASRATKTLPDSAMVCRGGACTAERFSSGSGVSLDASGKLQGVSVNSGAGKTIEELTSGIPNKQVGVTTVGDIRRAGGDVVPSPSASNPNHCTMCGVTPRQAEKLMTPTIRNPHQ